MTIRLRETLLQAGFLQLISLQHKNDHLVAEVFTTRVSMTNIGKKRSEVHVDTKSTSPYKLQFVHSSYSCYGMSMSGTIGSILSGALGMSMISETTLTLNVQLLNKRVL